MFSPSRSCRDRNSVPKSSGVPTPPGVRRLSRRALALVSVTLCAACVGYDADPLVPNDELRALLSRGQSSLPGNPSTTLADSGGWFPVTPDIEFGDGLTLQEANALALFHAPVLVAERTRQRVAAAQLLQAGLLPNPELFVGPRVSTEDSGWILPGSLMFGVPLGGELSAEEDAARAKLDSAAWRVMQTELTVLGAVRMKFLLVHALREERAQLETLSAEAQRIVEWVEQLASAGEVDVLTLQLARMEREDVATSVQRRDAQLGRATTELLGMIGLHPSASVEMITTSALFAEGELPPADTNSVLKHPRLRAQALKYVETDGLLRLAIARQYPEIGIGPGLEKDRGDLSIGLGLSIPIPFFDLHKGEIEEALVGRQEAREQYQETLLDLATEEAIARRQRDVALEHLRVHRDGPLTHATEAEQALADRLGSGFANVLEVLSALRAVSRVRVREIELRREVAEATLRAAVAGGVVFTEDPSSEMEEEK